MLVRRSAFSGAALGAAWGGTVLLMAPAGRTAAYIPDAIVYLALGALLGAGFGLLLELLGR